MQLNYHVQGNGLPIVLLHGLFGSLDNLGNLARELAQDHLVVQVDLRNHGLSPHSPEMTFSAMAEDLRQLFDRLSLNNVTVIGHSMGGKVAMALTAVEPERIARLIVIDIAPVVYPERRHDDVFCALNAVTDAHITQRTEASRLMNKYIDDDNVILFLLKSFSQGQWRFDVPALYQQYDNISGWQDVPTWHKPVLFIRGELSPYIKRSYWDNIARQFPQARAHVISGAGHWVHGEKPEQTLRTIRRFLQETTDNSVESASK